MKIGYLITARLKSTRLPKKLMLDINGETMIGHMVKRLQQPGVLDEIVICTSTNEQDAPLEAEAGRLGVRSFRGSEEDVLLRLYEAAQAFQLDYILNITGDCPLVSTEYIQQIVDTYTETNADLIRAFDLPHGAYSYGIKVSAIKEILEMKKSDETEVWGRYFTDSGQFEVVDLDIPQEHKRPQLRMTLDYPEDFEFFKVIFEHFKDKIWSARLSDILQFLDEHPEVEEINKHCEELYKKRWESQNKMEI